jgi:hypothetical protein
MRDTDLGARRHRSSPLDRRACNERLRRYTAPDRGGHLMGFEAERLVADELDASSATIADH